MFLEILEFVLGCLGLGDMMICFSFLLVNIFYVFVS